MDNSNWREDTLEALKHLFEKDEAVLSFSLFGSLSKPEVVKDKWSDIDAFLIVDDNSLTTYYPSIEWLKQLGEIYSYQQEKLEKTFGTKVIFSDFRKIDLVITTKSQVYGKPFWTKQQFIYVKAPDIQEYLDTHALPFIAPSTTSYNFNDLVRQFWYLAFAIVAKTVRNDQLTAFHAALDLYKYCLELEMWLRYKESGTHIHRTGGIGNNYVRDFQIPIPQVTQCSIIDFVEKCCQTFDLLANKWSSSYKMRMPNFQKVMDLAKEEVK